MDLDPQSPPPSGPSPAPSPAPQRRELLSARLIVGAIIAFVGLILLTDNLGWWEARQVLRSLWPLAVVAIGVVMVRSPDHRRSRAWGWVLITVGVWLFADKIGWIHISLWSLLVPAVLLFVGGMLVWRALAGPPQEPRPAAGEEHTEFVRSFAFMSACEVRPVSRPFRGADLTALMGGIKLDLFNARMEGDSATLDVFAFWGGIEIFVPPDWTVTSKVTTLMGGFIDKRRPTSVVPTKTLILRGTIVMSGIEIKN